MISHTFESGTGGNGNGEHNSEAKTIFCITEMETVSYPETEGKFWKK
jgi:hypothetical protein